MIDTMSDWGIRVKNRLIALRWSQKDLEQALEKNGTPLARTYISAVINGRVISESAVEKISDVLDIATGANGKS